MINYYFLFAGVLLFLALLVHMMAGDKEYRGLNPRKRGDEAGEMFGFWLMGRCTFQMVSVDLLLTSIVIFLMGIGVIPFNLYLAAFIALLYIGYLVFWLFTLLFSKAKPVNYLQQGQWMIFVLALVLIGLGLINQAS